MDRVRFTYAETYCIQPKATSFADLSKIFNGDMQKLSGSQIYTLSDRNDRILGYAALLDRELIDIQAFKTIGGCDWENVS